MKLHKTKKNIFISCLFLLSACSEKVTAIAEINWQKDCPGKQFCFQHPANFIDQKLPVIDSNSGQFTDGNMTLHYDFGWYANLYDHLPNPTVETIIIDGFNAQLILTETIAVLVVPSIKGKLKFSMAITYKNDTEFAIAKKILSTVTFNK